MILATIVNGIMMGTVYGLSAAGLSMIFGVMGIVNFSHGSFIMTGMFLTLLMTEVLGVPIVLAMPILYILYFLFGIIVQNNLINPILKRGNPIAVLLLTAGLMTFLEGVALFAFGPDYRTLHLTESYYKFWTLNISNIRLIAFIIGIVIIFALYFFVKNTNMGRAIQAVSQDREAARIMGVNDYYVFKIAFGLGLGITGISSVVLAMLTNIYPSVGHSFLFKAFIIVVLGGIGSIPGSLIGGIIVGIVEMGLTMVVPYSVSTMAVFIIFILTLLYKPSGLLGTKTE